MTRIIIPTILLLIPSFSYGQDFHQQKVILTTKIYGLAYYYSSKETESNNLRQRFVELHGDFQKVSTKQELNSYLSRLLSPFTTKNEITIEDKQAILSNDFQKVFNHNELNDSLAYPLSPDFGWIKDDLLDVEIQNILYSILLHYEPHKRKELKKTKYKVKHEYDYTTLQGDSSAIFALGMMIYWNMVEYFFPYKYLTDLQWDAVLKSNYRLFTDIQNKRQYRDHLSQLAAFIKDSHGTIIDKDLNVWYYGMNKFAAFPVTSVLIDDTLYVKSVAAVDEVSGLKKGDVITHINGIETNKYLRKISRTIIASNKEDSIYQLNYRIMPRMNHPNIGDTLMEITVNDKTYNLKTYPVSFDNIMQFYQVENYKETPVEKEIDERTGYIKLYQTAGRDFHRAMKKFQKKERIILDLRGYPRGSLIRFLAKNLSKSALPVAAIHSPSSDYPGFFKRHDMSIKYYIANNVDFILLAFFQSKGKVFPSLRKPYKGQLLVLIDESAISYAETVGMILKTYAPDVKFIGRRSNGANGDVVSFDLPYNLEAVFSGLHWHYANGDQLQRIGLVPDVAVKRSKEELLYNKDVILETAIQQY